MMAYVHLFQGDCSDARRGRINQQTKQDSLVLFPYVHVIEIANVITFAKFSLKRVKITYMLKKSTTSCVLTKLSISG